MLALAIGAEKCRSLCLNDSLDRRRAAIEAWLPFKVINAVEFLIIA